MQVLEEVVIARSERILGGNTEVIAFVLGVQLYILRTKAFFVHFFLLQQVRKMKYEMTARLFFTF